MCMSACVLACVCACVRACVCVCVCVRGLVGVGDGPGREESILLAPAWGRGGGRSFRLAAGGEMAEGFSFRHSSAHTVQQQRLESPRFGFSWTPTQRYTLYFL